MTDQELREIGARMAEESVPLSPEEIADLSVIFNAGMDQEEAA